MANELLAKLSHLEKQKLIGEICDVEGYDNSTDLLGHVVTDTVSPSICLACHEVTEMEPDQDEGYCDSCCQNAVVSALVLMEVI